MQAYRLLQAQQVKSPVSWRLQLQELASVQSVHGTAFNSTHGGVSTTSVASCLFKMIAHVAELIAAKLSEVAQKA
ncbi:hypothetical protein H257_14519 [Aphanomyces astaci]|uniref:Uncharacterized protein n=1 Tax=Aphanomyces astaci TaxID=112090 RepID=W4FR01_APHAT|nr:hypothetical protein H257_14519 [Aphanomyces astaci]ETV69922.1 hypothetical protein H257_14519 [Aphanomyces astaci]|eukprot:XP_009840660.1 hypothetical protein H257_14519 [Aphanomyces astaci]